jgi:hypothetical protein
MGGIMNYFFFEGGQNDEMYLIKFSNSSQAAKDIIKYYIIEK